MKTKEIGLLSNEALDAVGGGMMNNGQGQLLPKAPGALPGRGENGAPDHGPGDGWDGIGAVAKGLVVIGLAVGVIQGF